MGFTINTVYLSGEVVELTQPETVELSSGTTLKKITILVAYMDTNNGKTYKIPVEVLSGENKIEDLNRNLSKGIFVSIDARLISSQFMNKSTGKEVTFLKVDPYTINFPHTGQCIIFKSRFTGNMMNGYSGINPYRNMTSEQAQQAVHQKIEDMKQAQGYQGAPAYPKYGNHMNTGDVPLEEQSPPF